MKRLFTQLLALMAFVSANALEVGDYMYSPTNKFKVTGENLVVNGNFADLFDNGWTSEDGKAVNGEVWSTTTEDGRSVVKVEQQNVDEGNALANVWQLGPGLYAVSYWAKASSGSIVTTTTAGSNNYINFFASTDGTTNSRAISGAESISSTWTQVVDTIFVNVEQEFLVFNASGLPSGTVLTDFEIYPVEEVYDTRVVERLIKYAEALLNEPDLAKGKDDFGGVLETMKEMIQDPGQSEDADAMEGLIVQFNEEFDKYMDGNGADLVDIVGDWEKNNPGYKNVKNLTTLGSYTFEGGRWGFTANETHLDWNEGDGYIATALIQKGYNLNGTTVKVSNASLESGQKYFFSVEAQAVAAGWKDPGNHGWLYGSDHTVTIANPTIYVGSNEVVLPDTLNGYYWKRFYLIGEIAAGEDVVAGFKFPDLESTEGGRYSLRNPVFRLIGKSKVQVNWETALASVLTQQKELKNRIDTYMADVADYIWEKDSLQRAINYAQPIYEESLNSVDAEGNCTVEVSEAGIEELNALRQTLLDQVNALGRAKNWVINQNAIQETLKTTIADAQAVLDDPKNAGGDAGLRDELKGSVAQGQALLDNISELNQYDEFQAAINAINAAVEAFKITTANRSNPADIALVNADFSANSGNITTSGSFTNNGWNYTSAGTFKQWQYSGPTDAWEGSKNCNQWRGSSVTLGGKVQQTVTLTDAGVYEYRAMSYAHNDNLSYLLASAEYILDDDDIQIDTVYTNMPARLFFGLDGAPDSIRITKSIAPGANSSATPNRAWNDISGFTPWHYSVFFVKSDNEPVVVELGFEVDALDVGQGLNGFAFGANHVYFLGNEAKYTTDTKADLAAEVTKAKALAEANADNADVAFLVVKLNRYIANAENAESLKDMQNAFLSMQEIEGLIGSVTDGIAATFAEPVEAVKGVYTISGLKVATSVESLKPGLYIINGKKYVVK